MPLLDQYLACCVCYNHLTAEETEVQRLRWLSWSSEDSGLIHEPSPFIKIAVCQASCLLSLPLTSSPNHCPQFTIGTGGCPLSLPQEGNCPHGPTPKVLLTWPWPSLVSRQLECLLLIERGFFMWVRPTPAVVSRWGASQTLLGSGPSWCRGAGHLLSRTLPVRTPAVAGRPSPDHRTLIETLLQVLYQ